MSGKNKTYNPVPDTIDKLFDVRTKDLVAIQCVAKGFKTTISDNGRYGKVGEEYFDIISSVPTRNYIEIKFSSEEESVAYKKSNFSSRRVTKFNKPLDRIRYVRVLSDEERREKVREMVPKEPMNDPRNNYKGI